MPTLKGAGNARPITKLLLIGDSGTGKTGAIASLVKSGYRVRVLDYDNKIDGGILPILVRRDCPDKLEDVQFEPLRDKLKASPLGPILDGAPTAFTKGLSLLDKWSDGTIPAQWGGDFLLVVDSLTFLSDSAYNWARGMNPSAKDPRQWFYSAQQAIEGTIALLTSASFNTNVLVIAHVNWQNRPDGTMKGFPASVGQALGPTIPAYWEHMLQCQIVGGKREIRVLPTPLIDLKSPVSYKLKPSYPVETGLAEIFKDIRS